MANYGIKVSRQGFDVKTCADNQLLFSSSFKMLSCIQTGTYLMGGVNPTYTSNQTITTYSLSFFPVVVVFMKYQGSSGLTLGTNAMSNPGKGLLITQTGLQYFANDQTGNVNYVYFIMNLDLKADYTAPSVVTTAATQSTVLNNYGFKVSKDTFDVKTTPLQNLVTFSGSSAAGYPVRNQIIHKVGGITNQVTNSTATFAHGLGYAPMFMVYRQFFSGPTEYWYSEFTEYKVQGNPIVLVPVVRMWADATNINIFQDTGSTLNWRIVVFKDPLF